MFVVARKYLPLLLFILLNISGVKNEVLRALSSGMGNIQAKAVMIPYMEGRVPKTAVTIYGLNYFNTTISLLDSQNNLIFMYIGATRFTHYSVTIATLVNGFRIFDNGEEIHFKEADIKEAAQIYVSEPGLSAVVVYRYEPIWAFYDYHNVIGSEFDKEEIQAPTSFNLTLDHGNYIKYGDYLMFGGERGRGTKMIQIQLKSSIDTVLDLTLKLDAVPTLRVGAVRKGKETFVDTTSTWNILQQARFVVHLVCEHQGWRIYINGLDFHLFYHRLPPADIRYAVLKGNDWKIWKFMQKYS